MIERVWRDGGRFDGWSEYFSYERWVDGVRRRAGAAGVVAGVVHHARAPPRRRASGSCARPAPPPPSATRTSCSIYAVEEQPLPYLVMEFIAGETLAAAARPDRPAGAPEVLRIGLQIAEGLAAAHAQGLIHRDIKPANILLENGVERVKITDFGLARAVDDASLTQSGIVAGTPMYMSPEQAAGRADRPSRRPVQPRQRAVRDVHRPAAVPRPATRWRSSSAWPRTRRGRSARSSPRCPMAVRHHRQAARQEAGGPVRARRRKWRTCWRDGLAESATPGACPAVAWLRRVAADGRSRRRDGPELPKACAGDARTACRAARRWVAAAAVLLLLLGGLGLTEATGVTNVRGTVIRLFSPEGTLVVEVDDPGVSVQIDGRRSSSPGRGPRKSA